MCAREAVREMQPICTTLRLLWLCSCSGFCSCGASAVADAIVVVVAVAIVVAGLILVWIKLDLDLDLVEGVVVATEHMHDDRGSSVCDCGVIGDDDDSADVQEGNDGEQFNVAPHLTGPGQDKGNEERP